MKLIIENIGAITSASVDIGNLTVIAGENDVGKSTIGRVLFALVHGYSNFPALLRNTQFNRVRQVVDAAAVLVRRVVDLAKYPELRNQTQTQLWSASSGGGHWIGMIEVMLNQLTVVKQNESMDHSEILKAEKLLIELVGELQTPVPVHRAIADSVLKTLRSEFADEVVQKGLGKVAKLSLVDGATTIFYMVFNESDVIDFQGGDALGYNDATLIEGPAIFQFRQSLYAMAIFGEQNYSNESVAFHLIDFVGKLYSTSSTSTVAGLKVKKSTGSLYNGVMVFDPERNDFFFEQDGQRYLANNVASGIKALAMTDLLIMGNYVRNDTLLILDEPETNLHPKWQIAYAKLICKLAEEGKKILVTTHSPYILEALKGFSNKVDKTKFYLAQRNENQDIRFFDTFGNISPIIETLSDPLDDMLDELGHDY